MGVERVVGARKSVGVVLLFFLAGSLIHFALTRLYARHAYPAGSNRSFVDHPLAIIGVTVLGGLSVAWFMFRLLRKTIRLQEVPPSRVILRGGFYGIFATTAALELFYVLASAFLVARSSATYSSIWTFVSFFMNVQTYGMKPLILAAPVAFLYGAIGGATIRWLVPRDR